MPAPRRNVRRRDAASAAGEPGSAAASASASATRPAGDDPNAPPPLPSEDPTLFGLTLDGLAARWARSMESAPIGAEAMRGADRRAQSMGVMGIRLMENAGCAVAAAVKALQAEVTQFKGDLAQIQASAGPGDLPFWMRGKKK